MKKCIAIMLVLCMVAALCACGSTAPAQTTTTAQPEATATPEVTAEPEAAAEPEATAEPEVVAAAEQAEEPAQEQPVDIIVFAAASMTETLTKVADMYTAANPNANIILNFESSGTLKTQIREGAECDLFISAGQKQMNALDINASPDVNKDGLDFVLEGSRVNFLENKVTLVVPEGNPANIKSFDDLAAGLSAGTVFFAMGNSDVPVGQYTQKILKFYNLVEEELASCITYGSNVKEVTTQVKEASVNCGVVYCTDAFSAGLEVVDSATAEMCGQVIYPAAVMKNSTNPEAAQAFLDYLFTDEAMEVFESVGFSPVA